MTTTTETRSSSHLIAPTTPGIPRLPHIPESWDIELTSKQQGANLRHVALWIVERDLGNFYMYAFHLKADYAGSFEGSADRSSYRGLTPSNCGSVHCIAGFAQLMCGELGFTTDPITAGERLLGPEARLHFYDSNEDGLAFLKEVIARG
jgi:hypothetical protein